MQQPCDSESLRPLSVVWLWDLPALSLPTDFAERQREFITWQRLRPGCAAAAAWAYGAITFRSLCLTIVVERMAILCACLYAWTLVFLYRRVGLEGSEAGPREAASWEPSKGRYRANGDRVLLLT